MAKQNVSTKELKALYDKMCKHLSKMQDMEAKYEELVMQVEDLIHKAIG